VEVPNFLASSLSSLSSLSSSISSLSSLSSSPSSSLPFITSSEMIYDGGSLCQGNREKKRKAQIILICDPQTAIVDVTEREVC
jgi:hypothetical protein